MSIGVAMPEGRGCPRRSSLPPPRTNVRDEGSGHLETDNEDPCSNPPVYGHLVAESREIQKQQKKQQFHPQQTSFEIQQQYLERKVLQQRLLQQNSQQSLLRKQQKTPQQLNLQHYCAQEKSFKQQILGRENLRQKNVQQNKLKQCSLQEQSLKQEDLQQQTLQQTEYQQTYHREQLKQEEKHQQDQKSLDGGAPVACGSNLAHYNSIHELYSFVSNVLSSWEESQEGQHPVRPASTADTISQLRQYANPHNFQGGTACYQTKESGSSVGKRKMVTCLGPGSGPPTSRAPAVPAGVSTPFYDTLNTPRRRAPQGPLPQVPGVISQPSTYVQQGYIPHQQQLQQVQQPRPLTCHSNVVPIQRQIGQMGSNVHMCQTSHMAQSGQSGQSGQMGQSCQISQTGAMSLSCQMTQTSTMAQSCQVNQTSHMAQSGQITQSEQLNYQPLYGTLCSTGQRSYQQPRYSTPVMGLQVSSTSAFRPTSAAATATYIPQDHQKKFYAMYGMASGRMNLPSRPTMSQSHTQLVREEPPYETKQDSSGYTLNYASFYGNLGVNEDPISRPVSNMSNKSSEHFYTYPYPRKQQELLQSNKADWCTLVNWARKVVESRENDSNTLSDCSHGAHDIKGLLRHEHNHQWPHVEPQECNVLFLAK
ncbi:unnamed protein product, partial [Allacma fusca]